MYRSNQTDHSPPSIFHIVISRHHSTSPTFKIELPLPQPSCNRYHERQCRKDTTDTESRRHRRRSTYRIPAHTTTYESIETTEKTTSSLSIIIILTLYALTCPHHTSHFPSRNTWTLALCSPSRYQPLGHSPETND